MSLREQFKSRRAMFHISLVLVAAMLLAPTVALAAYGGGGNSLNAHSYPIGTVCGDALAGSWSTTSFSGVSEFRGWGVSFTLSNFVLTGGASGTVSSGSGSVSATGHGDKLLSATFSSMSGTYQIVGGSMKISFSVTGAQLTAPVSMNLGSPSLPSISVSCNTLDAMNS